MPNERLNSSQIMTIGAKALPILAVPRGWMMNRRIKMAQDVPMMVEEVMSGFTISRLRAYSAARPNWTD